MKHWRPSGKVLKFVVLTTIGLIAMRLFYVQELIALFLIFAAVLACVVALLVAGVLLNHAVQIAFGWTQEQRSAFIWRLRRSRQHTDKLPVGRPGAIEKEVEARIRQEKPTSFFVHVNYKQDPIDLGGIEASSSNHLRDGHRSGITRSSDNLLVVALQETRIYDSANRFLGINRLLASGWHTEHQSQVNREEYS